LLLTRNEENERVHVKMRQTVLAPYSIRKSQWVQWIRFLAVGVQHTDEKMVTTIMNLKNSNFYF